MGRHRHNRGGAGIDNGVLRNLAGIPGVPPGMDMIQEQLPSPQNVAQMQVFLIHHDEFANAHPAVIRVESSGGPFFKVLGGLSKLEYIAAAIGAGPLSASECVDKAKEILRLCAVEHKAAEDEKRKMAEEMVRNMQANGNTLPADRSVVEQPAGDRPAGDQPADGQKSTSPIILP